ncbi:MAG: hypothetical protein ABFQ53_00500 [Patescibacteria group bacterium]
MRKDWFVASIITLVFFLFAWYLVAHSFFDVQLAKQNAYKNSYGVACVGEKWRTCCEDHSKKYWQGGSLDERKKADKEFRDCVYKKTGDEFGSFVMYVSVRAGGAPYFAVPWRWGYGWEFGRGYR